MPSRRGEDSALRIDHNFLHRLRRDTSSWTQLLSFAPIKADALSDTHLRLRTQALLTLHYEHFHVPDPGLGPPPGDEALVAYLLDQEVRFHQRHTTMRPTLDLACFLLARYRRPLYVWGVWAAKHAGPYDVFVCVDIHYLYYAAGGVAAARAYVEHTTLDDVLGGARPGGAWEAWWAAVVARGGAEAVFEKEKTELLQRISRDSVSLTDEHVVQFISSPIRTDTDRWAESLS